MTGTSDVHTHAHSRIGASSAYRWFECPGSVKLASEVPPQETSVFAAEGTAAHRVAELCLMMDMDAEDLVGSIVEEFLVTEEMAEAVQVYLNTIRAYASQPGSVLTVEQRFHLHWIDHELFGTNDAAVYQPSSYHLIVVDYKHGRGVPVEAEGNKQLRYYALGAIAAYPECQTIEIVIVQPRCSHKDGPVRRAHYTRAELTAFENELRQAVLRVKQPNAPLKAGDHCGFCPAQAVCPALHNRAMEVANASFGDITQGNTIRLPEPQQLSKNDIKRVLDSADILVEWLNSVKAHALHLAKSGDGFHDYKLIRGDKHRQWVNKEETRKLLVQKHGEIVLEEPKEPDLLSPSQVEKALMKVFKSKKTVEQELQGLIYKPTGEIRLAHISEKGEAIPAEALVTAQFTAVTSGADEMQPSSALASGDDLAFFS